MLESLPINQVYYPLQTAFDHFNKELFDGALPQTVITVERTSNTYGYFSPDRWTNDEGEKIHEIALNSSYFGSSKVIKILSVLVHNQIHLWQHTLGEHKSSRTYHNAEFRDKSLAVGLQPTSDGTTGGKQTGQKITDLPIDNGLFIEKSLKLIDSGFKFELIDLIVSTPSKQEEFNKPIKYNVSENNEEDLIDSFASEELSEPQSEMTSEPIDETEINMESDNIKSDIDEFTTNDKDAIQKNVEELSSLELLDSTMSELTPTFEENIQKKVKQKGGGKLKYSCGCGVNIWAKPDIKVTCDSCTNPFVLNCNEPKKEGA